MQDEKRFYVYVHKLKETGEIRYVGKGTNCRYKSKSNRTQDHINEWDALDKEVFKDNLTEVEAIALESNMINSIGLDILINKASSSQVQSIKYEYVSQYFEYCESSKSGLIAKVKGHKREAGQEVGSLHKRGYWLVKLGGRSYKCHRIVYVLVNKCNISEGMVIDHIDSDPSNNKACNLQQITRKENSQKAKKGKGNTSGVRGIYWHNNSKTWCVTWRVDGKQKTKAFSPTKIFKGYPFEVAKDMALKRAKEFREEMVKLYYAEHSQ